ncbi:YjbH domain-containing protein [Aliishimia ponticola]|uniref:YjbH domain-containing protein n=1 Tax=Aliishimia ponticola TaxID=2499833 RepID=A0A4S4N7I5_9RHOB|nr:YjbH domain-containing protein [Aliishimia ponticola]THH35104.1 YjbH domain-containing protein [Aliishimia ponticola]
MKAYANEGQNDVTQKVAVAGLAMASIMTVPLWAEVGSLPVSKPKGANASYSTYGTPGLIDMPTALSFPDAELGTTVFNFGNTTRTTIAFQLTPRLTTSFRYSALKGLGDPSVRETLYDRSFDLHYRLVDETDFRPAIAIGLRDFIGTGVYSSEYVVASKSLGAGITVTGGVGWGRLGGLSGYNSRVDTFDRLGGQLEAGNWFRGNAELFGGIAWQATDKLQFKLEYSPDEYAKEVGRDIHDIDSPVNFGLDYRFNEAVSVQAFYMYGTTFGASLNLINNPKRSVAPSNLQGAPFPVRVRAPGAGRDLGWTVDNQQVAVRRDALGKLMENEGLAVERLDLQPRSVEIHIRNDRYSYGAEAVGRTARVLSQVMPDSVETFTIVPVVRGVPASAVTLQRRDVERFEHAADGSERMLERAQITDASTRKPARFDDTLYPKFTWGLGPFAQASYFDPDDPIRIGVGLELSANYDLAPGLSLSGSLRQRLAGDIGDSDRPSDSVIQKVRSESNIYDREGETALRTLTLDYYFKPGSDLYGRVSAGYLESQYGGLSAEVLWKPVQSDFAIGAEINYVKQRDYDQGFGFRDYEVATGHVSGYWDVGGGYHAQVDAGRYLAGDWGATVALDREFRNGWRVGAYATLTDVSFDDFGEGSFDKGLRITVPLSPLIGKETRKKFTTEIQPLTRDGGARLEVDGRLYETVREYHGSDLEGGWGRFWR